jgi:hypothetical protein
MARLMPGRLRPADGKAWLTVTRNYPAELRAGLRQCLPATTGGDRQRPPDLPKIVRARRRIVMSGSACPCMLLVIN